MPNPNRKIAKALNPARQLALRTLLSMQARNEKVQAALNTTLAAAPATVSQKDKALCTQLVYGCIRLKIRLDWILDKFLNKPESVPIPLRRVLRMAVFELFYLSHIPSYATLSSYVAAIKSGYGQGLAGLANAVLRKVSEIPAHDRDWFEAEIKDPQQFAEVWYSQPGWIINHFFAHYPKNEAETYLEASLETPPLGIRANPLKPGFSATGEELAETGSLLEHSENAYAYAPGKAPEKMGELLAKGKITRQSYAAQIAMQRIFSELKETIAAALRLGPVWDVCAGQGGKTCWMLERGMPVGLASDTNTSRLEHLQQEITRLGLPAPVIMAADASMPICIGEQTEAASPGIIFVDAPCSGLGTLARRPDIKIYRKPEELKRLAELQLKIAHAQLESLRPGGLLVYLTCTLNPDENQKVIGKLLEKNNGAKLIFNYQSLPENPSYEFFWAGVVQKQA